MRQVTSTSNGRVAVKGTHASGGFSVGRKIVLTLSQFSSISIPPHSEKLMVLPNLSSLTQSKGRNLDPTLV